jgi:hypothetical protein
MRFAKLLLICTCCLVAATAAWGQAANIQAKPGILGYFDPQTGAFRPLPQALPDDADLPPAATTFTGTINVTITVTLKTTTITTVTCGIGTSTNDGVTTATPIFYSESNSVTATGTGTTRTCKLSIPYAWSLATQSTDTMSTGYTVIGGTTTTGAATRTASRSPLDTRKVPANGATTTLTAAVTL